MSTTQPEALRLADEYAEASFDQGLHKRTLDDAPENARSALEAELRRLHQSEREGWRHASELEQERKRQHAALAHAERYAEQMGRELSKATAEIADLRARLASIAGGVSPLMGAAGDAVATPEKYKVELSINKAREVHGMLKEAAELIGSMPEAVFNQLQVRHFFEDELRGGAGFLSDALSAPSSAKGVAHG